MDLFTAFAHAGSWAWIVAGLVLLALELFVPGGYFLWLGVAAIVTGLMALFQAIPWPVQWVIFGALALVAIVLWTRTTRGRGETSDRPFLNRRAERLVGYEGVLDEPIRDGFGRLALGDSTWRVAGRDVPAGTRVRVIGHDGPVLRVEVV